jgi:hypothetical protein
MNEISTIRTKYTLQFLQAELPNYTARLFFEKYQRYLTPAFCFQYLYKQTSDPVYYNDLITYYSPLHTLEQLTSMYDTVMFNRQSVITRRDIVKQYCNGECNTCEHILYCF